MRVSAPEIKDRKQLFKHLKENKKQIIGQKRSCDIESPPRQDFQLDYPFKYGCTNLYAKDLSFLGKSVTKSKIVKEDLDVDEIRVDAIANMAGWCDSYMDVLIPDCWNKTISEKGASNKQLIYHLKNHTPLTDAIIGGDVKMSSKWMDLSMFNIQTDVTQGQALIGSSTVKKKYDQKCYHLYSDDEIKQHSIGLRYIKIFLCMNSEEDEYQFEKENWDKYYKYVINKDKVDGRGYFWAVTEIKLLEYSAVLYGANELTTVQGTSKNEPPEDTQKEPLENTLDYASLTARL